MALGNLDHCYCGDPDNPNMVHYNTSGTMCAIIESSEDDDHKMAGILGGTSRQSDVMLERAARQHFPNVEMEQTSETSCTYTISNIPNEQAMRIVKSVLPNVLELYLNKSKDYDGNVMAMLNLGPKASFVDLWRKVGKLKGALWDGRPMVGEQADEILADTVGHVLIILDEMR